MQLLSYLLRETSARADAAIDARSFASGVFVHGKVIGVRNLTRMFPKSIAVLIRFFAQLMVSHNFTTAMLQEGVMAPLHRDSRNAPGSKSLLVSLIP